uniref:Uncharacterized protein n=1 Tax=Meloidogyne incognita TaxID=6306 RepID=A0A914M913_MELIC
MNIPQHSIHQCITPEPTTLKNIKNAVVVDSLLCFFNNFRSLPQIKTILLNNFSTYSFRHSLELICNFVGEKKENLNFEEENNKQFLCEEILINFEKLIKEGKLPVFAASDLHCLPLRPFFFEENNGGGGGNNNNQLLDELRQIRFLLQDCLLLHKGCSFQHSTTNNSMSPSTHSIASITTTTATSSPLETTNPSFQQFTPIQEQQQRLFLPSLTNSPSTPTKGLRIEQVLQKLSKNKDVVDIVGNQKKEINF